MVNFGQVLYRTYQVVCMEHHLVVIYQYSVLEWLYLRLHKIELLICSVLIINGIYI